MTSTTPWTFLIVSIVLLATGEGLGALLLAQGWDMASRGWSWVLRAVLALWFLYGLVTWYEVPWVKRIGRIVVLTWVSFLAWLLCRKLEADGAAMAVAGAWAMAVGFYAGLTILRAVLSAGWPVLGVARTLVDEAVRMKVALILIIALVLFVPALPFVLDPEDQLRYRIQTFLTWSMMVVSVLLSLMTIFLAVGSITNEIANRQVYLSLTKPMGRGRYLLGKGIGIAALNLLLVFMCGISIYVFTRILEQQTAQNSADELAVQQQVLVARVAASPLPGRDADFRSLYDQQLLQLQRQDPDLYGNPGDPILASQRRKIQKDILGKWRSIAPYGTNTYRFIGLDRARTYADSMQLRLNPKAGSKIPDPEGFVFLTVEINGRRYADPKASYRGYLKLVDDQYHVLDIQTELIDEQGELEVKISNPSHPDLRGQAQPSIAFNAKDGLEILYRVGGFEGNLARSMLLIWIRLCFLAMLGLAAGTFLDFPIACLLAMLIFFTAASSGFIIESLSYYSAFPREEIPLFEKIIWWPNQVWTEIVENGRPIEAFRLLVAAIGSAFMRLVPKFSEFSGTTLLSDGRFVSYDLVGRAVIWIGLFWSGTAWVIGYFIFRSRELARVIV